MDGVKLSPLAKIYHPKGQIYHAMKKSDAGFSGFGETYFTFINCNETKGWKKHSKMVSNLIVPIGKVKVVVYDQRVSDFFSVVLSPSNYQRLTVEPNLWVAFKGIEKENLMLNVASLEHDPDEAHNIELKDIDYEW